MTQGAIFVQILGGRRMIQIKKLKGIIRVPLHMINISVLSFQKKKDISVL